MKHDYLIDQWRIGLRKTHRAHFEAAKYYQHLHLSLGIPTIALSTLFGTAVFTNLQDNAASWVKFVVAVLSLLMIVSTSLQTFLRYGERSERHRLAAVQIGAVRRELEQLLSFSDKTPINEAAVEALRKKWDSTDRQAPTIPTAIYERVAKQVDAAEAKRAGGNSPSV